MKNKKGKSFLGMLLLLIAIGVFGYFGYSTMNQIKLGLDLAGGVSITYQAKEENPSSEDMADTIYKLQQRVQNYSTEAEVYQEGNNRINVDIPGVSDANAILEELGKPGSLIFVDSEGNQILDGKQVASAKAGMTEDKATGSKAYVVSLTFTEEGKQAFAEATTNGVGKPIYIIYDNQIISAPTVREAITGGQCQIDGMADYEEANNLASTIRIGSLSLELEELRSNVVGAKLGQEAIATSLKAGLIGFAIVIVFMIAVYLLPGLAASLALCLYVGLILILLVAFEVTLTLPGVGNYSMFTGSDGNLYGRLDLDRYMIQFESERFMTFEISSEETQGLKIPVSSVMEKEFYTIPVDYMTTGGNATEDEAGFNKEVYGEGGKASIEFVTPEIYSSTDEYYYVEKSDDGLLKSGDYLVKPDSNERFQVGPTAKLTGAYNINKGYAVFKQVKELANSGEYYIVEKGTKYGLSVYDHIVLDASTVSDGQIVYQ